MYVPLLLLSIFILQLSVAIMDLLVATKLILKYRYDRYGGIVSRVLKYRYYVVIGYVWPWRYYFNYYVSFHGISIQVVETIMHRIWLTRYHWCSLLQNLNMIRWTTVNLTMNEIWSVMFCTKTLVTKKMRNEQRMKESKKARANLNILI